MNNILEKLPKKFIENMKILLGNNFDNYVQSMNQQSVRGIRINPIKVNVEDFENIFRYDTKHVPHEKLGRILKTNEKIGNEKEHASGMIYFQEPSSMLAVASIDWRGGEKVLDLCAAPGGKSSQAASYVRDGLIVSNEIVTARSKILFSNIERLGVKNSIILNENPKNIADKLYGFFDVILVDAPCSGEGMFRKDPDTIDEWNDEVNEFNAKRQLEILDSADKCLKTGGKLVYSTCTFSEIEDEDVVLEFLKSHEYKILETRKECHEWTIEGTKVKEARRFFPFTGKGEGQFVCVLEKIADEPEFEISKRMTPNFVKGKDKDLVLNFLKSNFEIPYLYELVYVRNEIMLVTKDMLKVLSQKLNFVNAGIRVGGIEKGILHPHHQLFSALGCFAKNNIELSDDEYKKYIHGEELEISPELKGYACVCVNGASLGGGKCVSGRLKNLYPKGLRI